jgi:hypothetical protein
MNPDRDRVLDMEGDADAVDVFDLSWTGGSMTGLIRVEFDLVEAITTAAIVVAVDGRDPVAVVSTDLPIPTGAMELRGPGIWLELVCETPLDHWTVGLEAFGVTVEADEMISVDTRGDLTPVGLDLDLDTIEPGPSDHDGALVVPVRVHGEVLIGPDAHEIDATGHRWRGGRGVPHGRSEHGLRDRLELIAG